MHRGSINRSAVLVAPHHPDPQTTHPTQHATNHQNNNNTIASNYLRHHYKQLQSRVYQSLQQQRNLILLSGVCNKYKAKQNHTVQQIEFNRSNKHIRNKFNRRITIKDNVPIQQRKVREREVSTLHTIQ